MGTTQGASLDASKYGSDSATSRSRTEAMLGTVDFMAPELAIDAEWDHRADIYSLGATIYFLLVGSPPFPEGTLAQKLLKHQMEQPPSILNYRSDVPEELRELVETMLEKEPGDRPQSVAEVLDTLTRLQK